MRRAITFVFSVMLMSSLLPIGVASASPLATTTVLEAPNTYGINAVMPLRIQVTNNDGSSAPTGAVTLATNSGEKVTTVQLTPTDNGGYSWAIINWWTPLMGVNKLRATYTPNSSNFSPSASTFAQILITEENPLAVVRLPDRFVEGTQANVTLLVNPKNGGGSATLNVNNRQIYASTPVTFTGQVDMPWTPTESIPYVITINYTNRDRNNAAQVRQSVFAFPN